MGIDDVNWEQFKEGRKNAEENGGVFCFAFENQPKKWWSSYLSRSTAFYCISAQAHNKLHMTRKKVATCEADGGTVIVEVTQKDQDRIIDHALKNFDCFCEDE